MSAVRHPMRRRILHSYLDGSAESPSAGELAEALDQPVGQVAYHLKTLAKCEILRPVQDGDGEQAEQAHYGWVLGVEADWVRLVLEVWAESDLPR